MTLDADLLGWLLAGRDPKKVLTPDGLMGELKKALAERMLKAELDHHLDSDTEQAIGYHRNGSSAKTVLTDDGSLTRSIPRDRHGRFEPTLIAKYRRRFPGFDDKIIALYSRGTALTGLGGLRDGFFQRGGECSGEGGQHRDGLTTSIR